MVAIVMNFVALIMTLFMLRPETYGKGGWNIQDVKWWLDCNMPKVEEG